MYIPTHLHFVGTSYETVTDFNKLTSRSRSGPLGTEDDRCDSRAGILRAHEKGSPISSARSRATCCALNRSMVVLRVKLSLECSAH